MDISIGGFFSLELQKQKDYLFKDFIHLNSGRNALEYILKSRQYTTVFLPYYTCDTLLEPIKKLEINYEFYDINLNLEPIFDYTILNKNTGFIITNYFGIKTDFINKISEKTSNLIIDNAQALYAKPIEGIDTFYSPRKFIGVPDGGLVSSNKILNISLEQDISYSRFSHLLKRIDLSAEEGYEDFQINDNALIGQDIKKMSTLTKSLLQSIDFNDIKRKRNENFRFLHQHLEKTNLFKIQEIKHEVPMVYPYLIENGEELKKQLISSKIYTATYWPNVLKWSSPDTFSYYLTENLLALPIDQRYNIEDMSKVLQILNG